MRSRVGRLVIALGCLCGWSAAGGAERSQSATLARTFTDLMAARHLEAIAVQDRSDASRFIAALFFPGSQLLVIAQRYPVPAHLQALVQREDYRQVYLDLQATPDPASQVFFHDLQADGLILDGGDVFYEEITRQTVFGGSWRKDHEIGERDYLETYRRADGAYAMLLRQLIEALEPVAAQ